jgi:pyridoxamine 5'-phosphate oxidase
MRQTDKEIFDMRRNYINNPIREIDMKGNPFEQFSLWFDESLSIETAEANAMVLSTCGKDNRPSSRVVLLKKFDEKGFTFFTNYESHKGEDILFNPNVALLFFWEKSMRQVRIEGIAEKTTAEESDEYFYSRPAESRITAAYSKQSKELRSKDIFKQKLDNIFNSGAYVKRPDNWGGYRVQPLLFEFWQGGPGRLHDRFEYKRGDDLLWTFKRLYP